MAEKTWWEKELLALQVALRDEKVTPPEYAERVAQITVQTALCAYSFEQKVRSQSQRRGDAVRVASDRDKIPA